MFFHLYEEFIYLRLDHEKWRKILISIIILQRNPKMKSFLFYCFSIFLFNFQSLFAQNDEIISIGSTITIHSDILNEERKCLISIPESYYEGQNIKEYPVMILLDGSVHFKMASGVTQFMSSDRNRNYFIPEMIIVAIENVDRERDFTVTKIKTARPNTMGGGRNFLSFIENELIPYVDENYRTKPERILVGHSLGGLLTLNSFRDEKSLFDAYLAIDPSIWWVEEMMKEKVDSIPSASFNKKLYLATANQGEANFERNKKRHDRLFQLLQEKSSEPMNLKLDYFENENHRSVPLSAMYEGLKYLFLDFNQ